MMKTIEARKHDQLARAYFGSRRKEEIQGRWGIFPLLKSGVYSKVASARCDTEHEAMELAGKMAEWNDKHYTVGVIS